MALIKERGQLKEQLEQDRLEREQLQKELERIRNENLELKGKQKEMKQKDCKWSGKNEIGKRKSKESHQSVSVVAIFIFVAVGDNQRHPRQLAISTTNSLLSMK